MWTSGAGMAGHPWVRGPGSAIFGLGRGVFVDPGVAELARYDARDAVAAHAHAVERVGRVHGALLMGHHDELGAVGIALHELQEAIDVDVVERGLDLVEDVERARPRQ